MNRTVLCCLVVALVTGVLTTSSPATQVIPQTPQELARAATLIVDGKVAGVRSYWNDDHTKIFTETTITVANTHKGTAPGSVRIVQPGGVVGNVRQTAHGALMWQRGEEVLVMLEPGMGDAFQVAGFSQGKYEIERDSRTGRAYVRQSLPPDGGHSSASSRALSTRRDGRLTLEQFLDQVLPSE